MFYTNLHGKSNIPYLRPPLENMLRNTDNNSLSKLTGKQVEGIWWVFNLFKTL